jgi:hypothetical protein
VWLTCAAACFACRRGEEEDEEGEQEEDDAEGEPEIVDSGKPPPSVACVYTALGCAEACQ